MNKSMSQKMTAAIANYIATKAPYVDYNETDIEIAKKMYTDKQLEEFRLKGYLDGDYEKFYVCKQFLQALEIWGKVDEDYILKLFENFKRYEPSELTHNRYMKDIKISDVSYGDFLLTNVSYDKGEILQYDMPDLRKELVVPKLAFFTQKVSFPAVYEGNIPWVSVCPSEINSMQAAVDKAYGKVLVLGLGLGYYPYMISLKDEVSEIVIVELQPEIIKIFEENVLPQFSMKEKIKVVKADAVEYLENVKNGDFDYCFADIWDNQFDGAENYLKIKRHEHRLPDTTFDYWIGDEIEWWLENEG